MAPSKKSIPDDLADAFGNLQVTNSAFLTSYKRMSKNKKRKTLIRDFSSDYSWASGDGTKLEKWQRLCSEVGIEDVPGSIRQCKVALNREAVNIWDLMRYRMGVNKSLYKFPSKRALRNDARANPGRRFPIDDAKEDGFIKVFLVDL